MNHPKSTLVALVTCSRDETRRDLAIAVTKNMAELIPQAGLQNSFVVFDNASTYKEHLQYVPKGAVVIESRENLGYWSAIKWILDHMDQVTPHQPEFIYMVESDLTHSDLRPLGVCEEFLRCHSDASCVRTQEFSVRNRWRFDKALKFLPFHVTRSEIHLKNAVSGEKAWFRPVADYQSVYLSNLHAKIPALNRISSMQNVFQHLSEMEDFTEHDFFIKMREQHPHIGVYDGGLFHSLISREDKGVISGSYSSAKALAHTGYQQTRKSKIISNVSDFLSISRNVA